MGKRENRNILLASAGVGVSRLGTALYSFAIGLYVLRITGSGQSFALTLMLGILPRIILGPLAGNLSDRMNRKILIVGADLFCGFLMLFLVFLTRRGRLSLSLIYLTTFLLSLGDTFLETAFTAAQRDLVFPESLTRLSSLRQSVISLVNLVSPLLAGFVYALLPLWCFLVLNGVSFFLSALSETAIDFHFNCEDEGEESGESFWEGLIQGFRYFRKDRLIMALSICAMGLNFFLSSLSVLLPYGLIHYLMIPENIYGILLSAASGGAFLGAMIAGKVNRILTRKYLLLYLGLLGILLALTGVAFQMGHFFPATTAALIIAPFPVLITAAAMLINIPLGVFFQSYVNRAFLGRVGSLTGAICEAVMPLSYLLYGFLTGFLSPLIILGGSGILILILVLAMTGMDVFNRLDIPLSTDTPRRGNKEFA